MRFSPAVKQYVDATTPLRWFMVSHGIYDETPDGKPVYNFYYVDQIYDVA